jgi:hypothetical protein
VRTVLALERLDVVDSEAIECNLSDKMKVALHR